MKFVLASNSPRRHQLLSQFDLDLIIASHTFNESSVKKEMKPEEYSLGDLIKEYDKLDQPLKFEYIKGVCVSLVTAYDLSQSLDIRDTINKVFKDTEIYCEGYLDYIISGSG